MGGYARTLVFYTCFKTFCLPCILADHDAEHNVQRATILYAPLYPSFEDRLNRFRQAETSDLQQRGAERIIDNAGIYDSQRSSEDASVDLVAPLPEDIPSRGPPDAVMMTSPPGMIIRDRYQRRRVRSLLWGMNTDYRQVVQAIAEVGIILKPKPGTNMAERAATWKRCNMGQNARHRLFH